MSPRRVGEGSGGYTSTLTLPPSGGGNTPPSRSPSPAGGGGPGWGQRQRQRQSNRGFGMCAFRALVLHEEGGKIVPRLETLDDSRLPPGDVTVRVEYSTLNYK